MCLQCCSRLTACHYCRTTIDQQRPTTAPPSANDPPRPRRGRRPADPSRPRPTRVPANPPRPRATRRRRNNEDDPDYVPRSAQRSQTAMTQSISPFSLLTDEEKQQLETLLKTTTTTFF